jgi:hypothetical protein
MDYNDLPGMLLENLAICWAQYGIDWEEDPGYDGNVSYCTFENCLNAIWLDMYDDILTLWDDVCCNVSNQVYVQSGAFSGTMGNCALLYWASPGLMPTALRGTNASGGGSVTQEVDIACTNFLPTDTTVYYTISGTASNGGDYQTLTGSVLVPATGSGGGSVFIQPIYRTNLGFDPIVVLTLVPANGYQIISNLASVSVPIMDHFSSNIFTVVASPNQAVDVDYSTVSTSLVVSVNYPNGLPENFALLGTNGIPARWSGVSGLPNNSVGGGEVNLATIKAAGNTNFKVGDVYFIGEGTGSIGVGIEQRKLLQHELAHTVQRDGPRRGFRPLPGPDRRVGVQPASGDEPSGDQPERCLEDRRANELYPARVQPPCREHGGAADRAPRHQLRSVGR